MDEFSIEYVPDLEILTKRLHQFSKSNKNWSITSKIAYKAGLGLQDTIEDNYLSGLKINLAQTNYSFY